MNAKVFLLLLFACSLPAAQGIPGLQNMQSLPSALNVTEILAGNQTQEIMGAIGQSAGVLLPQATQALPQGMPTIPSGLAGGQQPAAQSSPPFPRISISQSQLRDIVLIAIVFCYVFAAGKIADFLRSSGKKITRREAILAPFAYMLVVSVGALAYFSSGAWVPPQHTLITMGVYLLLAPLGIAIGLGAIVLHAFFRKRLTPLESLDFSMRVMLAPVFDGMHGYWTALGAASILVFLSGFTYWSSGGNLGLVTLDFLLLSAVASLYFLYGAIISSGNEDKASNLVALMVVLSPSVLRLFFKDIVCAGLSLIPLDFFRNCPLLQAGNEVTLALSVLATLLMLLPVIPMVYALIVNLLRFATVLEIIFSKEHAQEKEREGRD